MARNISYFPSPNRSARTAVPIYICIHRMQGYLLGTRSHFLNSDSEVSADLSMNKEGTAVDRFNRVSSGLKCWAVGNANSLSVSIETEGFVGDEDSLTADFFDCLAELCIILQKEVEAKYGNTIPLNLTGTKGKPGIVGHHQLALWYGGSDHTCPGPNFPFDKLEAAIDRRLHPEVIEVRHGNGGRRRYVVGKIVKGAGAPVRASRYVLTLLRQGRKKITVTRKES